MKISALKANKRNPRKITDKKLMALEKSMAKFGDLGCIVWNMRTKTLVSGHQRVKTLPKDLAISMDGEHEGEIVHLGQKFKFRVVDWDATMEMEALIAANKHGGTWDEEIMKINLADFPNMDLEMAGFEPLVIQEPIKQKEQTDEQYVASTAQTTEQIDTQSVPSTDHVDSTDAFNRTEETTAAPGRRFVIIIDCKDQDMKDALKEKLRPVIDESGAKIF